MTVESNFPEIIQQWADKYKITIDKGAIHELSEVLLTERKELNKSLDQLLAQLHTTVEKHKFVYVGGIEIDLSQTLAVLDLSSRARNCMIAEGIRTLGDLVGYDRRTLLKCPNLSTKTLKEITDALMMKGLVLKGDTPL